MNLIKNISVISFLIFSFECIAQVNCSSFSTYFGGTQTDEIKSLCMDAHRNTYVIGNTYSTDLPVTTGLINDTHSGNYDVFISKFDSCGNLVWGTYFGGPNFDSAEKMVLTKDGNIVFCGFTNSLNTPTTTGCFQGINNGNYDCFITKISTNGNIIWSTFFGKSGGDFAFDIKTDILDNIVIGGTTTSTDLYTTASSFQPNHKGNTDAFIARFSKNGELKWCTYYGGSNSEDIHNLETDQNCNIIGAGGSFSSNLHTSSGAHQSNNDGASDAYLIKLDSNCTEVFSTYLGGSLSDDAWGLACDASGTIYLAGHTNCTDFDTTALSFQTLNKGGMDWYITKWSPTGSLLKSTLLGGSLDDYVTRLILYSPTELLILGETQSTDLPLYGTSNQQSPGGNFDVFLAKINTSTLAPDWTSYYGGSADEDPFDLIGADSIYIEFAGSTNSVNYPLSLTPYQSTLNMSSDGFITKLKINSQLPTSIAEPLPSLLPLLYPNPCTDSFRISYSGPLKPECKDILGKNCSNMIHEESANRWNVSRLNPGIYFISISTSAGTKTLKLVKE